MGSGTFDRSSYTTYSNATASISREARFTQSAARKIHADLDPLNIQYRESCDSQDSPNATPIIFGLDVTGSMGFVAERIAATKLGDLIVSIMDSGVVSNPHIMFMGLGDLNASDSFPIQLSQFEADNRIVQQLTQMYLEGGGGGNDCESYDAAWYMAAHHTKTDSFNKRNKKGLLFTIGDEMPPNTLPRDKLVRLLGRVDPVYAQHGSHISSQAVYEQAALSYDVFHIIASEGSYARGRSGHKVYDAWQKITGRRTIWMDNVDNLVEIVNAVVRVNAGEDPQIVIDGYTGAVKVSVEKALYGPEQSLNR